MPALALAELDHAAALQRLERRQPQPHPGRRRAAGDAVVGDLEHERAVGVARPARSTRVGCACLWALRTASASTDCASGSRLAGTSPASPASSVDPELGVHARRAARPRPTNVVWVARGARPSGRWSAVRSSPSASCVSLAHRSRASAGRSPSPSSAIETPNSRWITPSWISRARSIRCSSWRARLGLGRRRSARPTRAPRPCRASTAGAARRRRAAGSTSAGRRGSRRSRGPPAAIGAHTSRTGSGNSAAYSSGTCAAHVALDLDHLVLAQRLGGDRRRLDGHVRARRTARGPARARPTARTRRSALS